MHKWLSVELSLLLLVSLVAFAGFANMQSSEDNSESVLSDYSGDELTGDWKKPKLKFAWKRQKPKRAYYQPYRSPVVYAPPVYLKPKPTPYYTGLLPSVNRTNYTGR